MPTPIIQIHDPRLAKKGVELLIKREDLNHPVISGNKWRKLKYNLEEAKKLGHNWLLTFGGAYSNHIYATAGAGKEFGFETIGVIRGEEHLPLNPTLSFAKTAGMQLHYIDRTSYRRKSESDTIKLLKQQYGDFYLIPEGGTNELAIRGCEEIVTEIDTDFDYLCCPVGTGGTVAGLISGLQGRSNVIGFSSLKGDFLQKEVALLLKQSGKHFANWSINTDYHFGGYAKTKPGLIDFMKNFEQQHHIPLDPVYTAKMLFGIYELIETGVFPAGTRIVAVHTGGLQGRKGFGL
ncbi:MAG: 1-aminocyclopropane-1-carboxylate deaminase/D-cysteine desulfhydrase [Roseivirga sp.]|nr:1-aminocyclopropane-1-carboxylate deaminase/D-cysteine desulfhydrase [Roseivirga sp.]